MSDSEVRNQKWKTVMTETDSGMKVLAEEKSMEWIDEKKP